MENQPKYRWRFVIKTNLATYEQDRSSLSFAEAIADMNPEELESDHFMSREDLWEGGMLTLTEREMCEEMAKADQILWERNHK